MFHPVFCQNPYTQGTPKRVYPAIGFSIFTNN